jgi:hypothetical protein
LSKNRVKSKLLDTSHQTSSVNDLDMNKILNSEESGEVSFIGDGPASAEYTLSNCQSVAAAGMTSFADEGNRQEHDEDSFLQSSPSIYY